MHPRILIDDQTQARIKAGWQCPECYGPQIENRDDCLGRNNGFVCTDCGCEFGGRS